MNQRTRVIQIFNDRSFCSHLFLSATVYPGSKWVPCCKASGTDIKSAPVSSVSYKQYVNSEHIHSVRKSLENKNQDSFCSACMDVENTGGVSDRMSNNDNWLKIIQDQDLYQPFIDLWDQTQKTGIRDGSPWHWYLFLDNTCQARCVMCDPTFSSSIEKEYARLDLPKIFFAKDQSNDRIVNDPDAVISEFKIHASQVRVLQLLGGEPTLSSQTLELLEWLIAHDYHKQIFIKINTNGIKIPQHWIETVAKFYKSQWSVSVDAIGELNRWIRYPTDWNQLNCNLDKLAHTGSYIMIKTAIHAMNAHYLPELYSWAQERNLRISWTFVQDPDAVSLSVLDDYQRQTLIDKYQNHPAFLAEIGQTIISHMQRAQTFNQDLMKFISALETVRPVKFQEVNQYF